MEIILIKDHESIGRAGDELEVKDGYARNYLIPKGYAVRATRGVLKQLEQMRMARKKQREEEIKTAEKTAEQLKTASCTITMEAGEENKLFGSVTAGNIAEALEKEGIKVDKKQIILDVPLNALGVYTVKAKLHPEVKTSFRVWVVEK